MRRGHVRRRVRARASPLLRAAGAEHRLARAQARPGTGSGNGRDGGVERRPASPVSTLPTSPSLSPSPSPVRPLRLLVGARSPGHCETRTTPLRPLLGGPDRDQDEAARAHRAESLPRSPSSIAGPGASSASAHETDSIGAPTRSREQDLPCESHRAWRAWSHEAWRTTACADDTQAPEIAEQARLSLARKATREQRRLVPRRRRCRVGRGRQQGRHPR